MKTFLLIAILLAAAFVSADAQVDTQQQALDSGVVLTGQTVIMGTWMWDIERNSQKRSPNVDVWWQQVNDVDQFLVPRGRSRIVVVDGADYHALSDLDLRQLKFSRGRVSNRSLVPGAVLALRTAEGNLAKIRVIGYRDLHDDSFADARQAWPGWYDFLHRNTNRPNYHLEIEWTLYTGRNTDL